MNDSIFKNAEAEDQLLGAMILGYCSNLIDSIEPDYFSSEQTKNEYLAIRSLIDENPEVDSAIVASKIGIQRTTELMRVGGKAESASRLVSVLKQCHECRSLYLIAHKTCEDLKNGADPEELKEEISNFIERRQRSTKLKVSQLSDPNITDVAFNRLGSSQTDGIKCGFKYIDGMLLGFKKGSLNIVAARPSEGKSALLQDMMLNIGKTGKHVVLFSMENSIVEVAVRCLMKDGNISYNDVFQNPDYAQESAMEVIEKWKSDMNITIYESPRLTIGTIQRELKRLKRIGKQADICFVDYVQLMKSDDRNEKERSLQLEMISQDLKNTAMEFDIPIVAAAQLNRDAEGNMPMMKHLKGSGGIEQAADVILLIDRSDEDATGNVGIIIAKNRNGFRSPNQPIMLGWLPNYAKFVDV